MLGLLGRTEGSALGLSERKSGQERSILPQRGLCLASVSLSKHQTAYLPGSTLVTPADCRALGDSHR